MLMNMSNLMPGNHSPLTVQQEATPAAADMPQPAVDFSTLLAQQTAANNSGLPTHRALPQTGISEGTLPADSHLSTQEEDKSNATDSADEDATLLSLLLTQQEIPLTHPMIRRHATDLGVPNNLPSLQAQLTVLPLGLSVETGENHPPTQAAALPLGLPADTSQITTLTSAVQKALTPTDESLRLPADTQVPVSPVAKHVLKVEAPATPAQNETAKTAMTPAVEKTAIETSATQAIQTINHLSAPAESQGVSRTAVIKLNLQQPEPLHQQLRTALGERLQLQVDNRIQHATIRLDPPDMGKIEISLHIEAGKLQVNINASQNDVYRALQQVSQELRQNLTEQNFVQVNVQVSTQQQQNKQGHRQQHQQEEILDAASIESTAGHHTNNDDSILMTV